MLSEVCVDGDEQVHMEIENFGCLDAEHHHIGMSKAGTDEEVVLKLTRAGSLDITDTKKGASAVAAAVVQEEELK